MPTTEPCGSIPTLAKRLLTDRDVADRLAVSPNTIRTQRHLRLTGKPHWFILDPIMIGSCPRYDLEEFEEWLASRRKKKEVRR